MPIKSSSSAEIRGLVAAFSGDDEVQREAAVARLSVIGARAVDRLLEAYAQTGDRRAHVAILQTLERIGDYRAAPLARQAIAEGGDIGVAAAGVLRTLLTSRHAATATLALDTLIATTLDSNQDRRLRLAAFDGLEDMPEEVRAPIAEALRRDDKNTLREIAAIASKETARATAVWTDAIDGRLPENPADLREALNAEAASAPLNHLRKLVDAVRTREREASAPSREGWVTVRGALHQALALRGSRVALYDLRETVEAAGTPLPASFLAALHVLGDASCLEPLAVAWAATAGATTPEPERWRQQLETAFRAIVQREKLTKRSAAMKRVAGRWPELVRLKPDTTTFDM